MGQPTRRPTDAEFLTTETFDPPASLLNQPWIDPHSHAQTLSWADREQYALTGCQAMVMVASGYHWTPYKPVTADDVRFLWDDCLNRQRVIERDHFFETKLALGIHTGVRISNPAELLDALRDYCREEAVVAVGETGITPAQHVERWSVADQRDVVREQLTIAAANDLPVLVHTPAASTPASEQYRSGVGVPGFERNGELTQPPVITDENAALAAVREDVAIARESGIDERAIVASHADTNNAQYLLEETDCWLSFTLGYPWLTGVTAETVAQIVDEYGPERIMVETDAANVLNTDVSAIKRAIMTFYRCGLESETIDRIVFENPRDVFGFAQ